MAEINLARSIERYALCSPYAIASSSEAAITYFVEDAKKDIATLAARIAELESALEPFAAVAERILAEAPSDAEEFTMFKSCVGLEYSISLDALRRAAILAAGGRTDG